MAASALVALPGRAAADGGHCPTDPARACFYVQWSGDSIAPGDKTILGDDLVNLGSGQQDVATYTECAYLNDDGSCHYVTDGLSNGWTTGGPATPLRQLVADLGFVPSTVATLTLHADGQTDQVLTSDDLREYTDPLYPFQGTLYPVVYSEGQDATTQLWYLRPQRADDDVNWPDRINTSGEIDITIVVTGVRLVPTLTVTKTSPTTVTLTAAAPAAHGTVSYDWDFGDGQTDPDGAASVTHTYTGGGSRTATVTVTDSSGGAGTTSRTFTVGSPATSPSTGTSSVPGGGTGTRSQPAVGPTSGTGVHVGAGSSTASEGPTASSLPPTAPAARPSSGAASSSAPARSSASAAGERGLAVNGLLLNPAGQTPAVQSQQRAGRVGAAPASRRAVTTSTSSLFALVLVASLVVLLALGATTESRRPGRRPRRRA